MAFRIKRSRRLYKVAARLLPGGVNSPVRSFMAVGDTPVFISRAKGAHVYDEDGNKYIDYVGSWGPLILGHAHPDVSKEIKSAADRGTTYGAPTERENTLANLIIKSFPSIEMIRMTSSGTEATMTAVRLARACTGRDMIVKFEGCYHGHADYLLVKAGSGATTFGTPSSPGIPKASTKNTLLAKYNDIGSVSNLFAKHRDKIACVLVEPVAANMGVVPPKDGFLEALRNITRDNGAVLIFDEVITGFRLGLGGAQKTYRVASDLTCLGKIIGGGLPVGAYGGKRDMMNLIAPTGPVYHAGTLSGNPLAMSAGIATLRNLSKKGTYKRLNHLTDALVGGLTEAVKKLGLNAHINSVGSMFTLFFTGRQVVDYASALSSDTKMYSRFFKNMLRAGIMFPPSQFEACFLSLAHSEKDIDATLKAAYAALRKLKH